MEGQLLFDGINEADKVRLFACLQPVKKSFAAGETILSFADTMQKIGVVLSGRAYLLCIDDKGRESRLERLGRDDVFGEMFALPMERLSYFVVADTASDVLFIDYAHVISRCENACAYHSQLVHNLFQMTARKARIQTMHVSVLSQRTLRQKLLTYFELLCRRPDGTGRLDMSYSALADYLCIDRSAMMREIKKLKEEGLVAVEGKEIRLL